MALQPAKKPAKSKGTPPTVATPPNGQENTRKKESGELININFKTDKEFAKDWKVYCVTNDVSQVDQFKKMFDFWKQHHGE